MNGALAEADFLSARGFLREREIAREHIECSPTRPWDVNVLQAVGADSISARGVWWLRKVARGVGDAAPYEQFLYKQPIIKVARNKRLPLRGAGSRQAD